MSARCYLCGGGIITAVRCDKTVSVDALPHHDGQFTLAKRGLAYYAFNASAEPYARPTPTYRLHRCEKPVAA